MNAIDKIVRYILMILLWGAGFIVGGLTYSLGNFSSVFFGSILLIAAAVLSRRASWQPRGTIDKLTRYGFLVMLWFVTFIFSLYALTPIGALFILWFVAMGATLSTSLVMFPRYTSSPELSQRDDQERLNSTKRKNDLHRPIDPLDLLTDDDLAELRQEIKDEIRMRLRYGSVDEVSSLEELIEERQPPVRAKRK